MTMQALLEKDKERILQLISGLDSTDAVIREMERQLSRMLYAYTEEETSEAVKEAAYQMTEAAKSMLSLIDSAGEAKIYGRSEYGKKTEEKAKPSRLFGLFLVLGLICIALPAVYLLFKASSLLGIKDFITAAVLLAVGMVMLFLAGKKSSVKSIGKSSDDLFAESLPDGKKVYRSLLSMALVMDKNLEEVRKSEELALKAALKDNNGIDQAEIDLFAELLEECYGEKDQEYAQEMISHLKYYLHHRLIEALDYTKENRAYFDLMPGSAGTIRPALVMDGKLLKKGLAAGGR